jgi:hypothetical protein
VRCCWITFVCDYWGKSEEEEEEDEEEEET